MGKISEWFNFDNIGQKIKNLTKWSCWITILLVWIAAPIAFIVLVADDWTAYLCWIPLVAAIVIPFIIWVGSWAMYAFGQLVDDTQDSKELLKKIEGNTKSHELSAPPNFFVKPNENKETSPSTHKWLCDGCGNMRTQTPCEHCGIVETTKAALTTENQVGGNTWICGKCGKRNLASNSSCWSCGNPNGN